MADAPLQTLLRPFETGALQWPSSVAQVLFLRARDGWATQRFRECALTVTQPFKPEADRLEASGLKVADEDSALRVTYDCVLVLPPRSRDEARALLAKAAKCLAPGGVIVASVANNEGANSVGKDMLELLGETFHDSKNKCRVMWSKASSVDAGRLASWSALDEPRAQKGTGLLTKPGIFSWEHVDPASELLVEHMPAGISGEVADLGAGIGYLGVELLKRNAGIRRLDSFEAQAEAIALAEGNLRALNSPAELSFHWADVTRGLPRQYDFIITNPPFHAISRDGRPDVGQEFIRVAASSLKIGGRLLLVANRHLPYEQVLGEAFGDVQVLGEGKGFKVILAVRA